MNLPRFKESIISRDLKINLQRSLEKEVLDKKEIYSLFLCGAMHLNDSELIELFEAELKLFASEEEILLIKDAPAIITMLNLYYKTKFSLDSSSEYERAELRMQSLFSPTVGKTLFEMLAFGISALNGCQYCLNSHEKSLKTLGVSVDKIHEIIRIMAILGGLKKLL